MIFKYVPDGDFVGFDECGQFTLGLVTCFPLYTYVRMSAITDIDAWCTPVHIVKSCKLVFGTWSGRRPKKKSLWYEDKQDAC